MAHAASSSSDADAAACMCKQRRGRGARRGRSEARREGESIRGTEVMRMVRWEDMSRSQVRAGLADLYARIAGDQRRESSFYPLLPPTPRSKTKIQHSIHQKAGDV